MRLNFDLGQIRTVEFGVGRDARGSRDFVIIPVDLEVQNALSDMVRTTRQAIVGLGDGPTRYEPSEKHAGMEYLSLPLNDALATAMRTLHQASNLPIQANALREPEDIFAYFAKLTDAQGRNLTALRRASQFKGILKNRLIRLVTDTMRLVEDHVFKLDTDFDLLIDNTHVHILRPASFEFAGQLQQAIMDAVPTNIASLESDLGFVSFDSIGQYASFHPRAARYVASIRASGATANINKRKLKALCQRTGVSVSEQQGQLHIESGFELAFLEVLDRRRYELELIDGQPELYRAPSRQRIGHRPGRTP